MTKLIKAAGIAGILIAAALAASPSLPAAQTDATVEENQAVVTQLDANATAVSYWASASDGWHVVTTVDSVTGADSEAEQHAIVRFSATLADGQEQLISVPGKIGERPLALRIRRQGDRIEMENIADTSL